MQKNKVKIKTAPYTCAARQCRGIPTSKGGGFTAHPINTKEVLMPDQESERLKRLREKQLTDRDPLTKQRTFQRTSSVKEKRMRKPFSFPKAWSDIPNVIKYPFYALILGVIIMLILPTLWISSYAFITSLAVTAIMIIFGLILGNSIDLRDEIKDNLK